MGILTDIFHWNYILTVSVVGWLLAQVLKTVINCILIGIQNI